MKFHPLRVEAVVDETAEARSFALRPPDEHRQTFVYQAGQFLTFQVPWNGRLLERCYSLCSAPACDTGWKVAVKRVKGGKVSNWFNDTLAPGDIVHAAAPSGRFTLRDRSRSPILFAGGSGITPVISLIKQILHDTSGSARLLYANTDRDQVIFGRELDALESCFPERFHCHHHLDARDGLVAAAEVENLVGASPDGDFFICGPSAFMDMIEGTLERLGIPRGRIHLERFSSPDDPAADGEPTVPGDAATDIATFRATLDGQEHEIPYIAGETLLDCMLAAGLEPVFSCREAHCGSCMVTRNRGEVKMRKSTVLSRRDKERGYVLLCQALPRSRDVWVDCDI